MYLLALLSVAFGTVVVDFEDGLSLQEIRNIASEAHLSGLHLVDVSTADEALYLAEGDSTSLKTLLQNSHVSAAEGRITYSIPENDSAEVDAGWFDFLNQAMVDDPQFVKQWHMTHPSIDAEWVWSHTRSGKGVVVAVLDTGLTVTKDFNKATVAPGGKSFIPGESIEDGHGHGSHCAGTIAQWTNNGFSVAGLAHEAKILPVKVLSDFGSGSNEGIAAGIYYAVEQGADVISMSLGGPYPSEVINKAIDKAIDSGVIVVAAAGNDGCHDCLGYPGGYEPVIAVGAIGPDSKRAPYSSYGAGLDIMAPGGNKSISGGGVFQYIPYQGRESLQEFQGTSMATPHVAAAVAILLGEGAPKDQKRMTELLASTATKHQDDSRGEYGLGTIDLKAAVQKVGRSSTLPRVPSYLWVNGLAALLVGLSSYLRKLDPGLVAGVLTTVTVLATACPLVVGMPFLQIPDLLIPGLSAIPLWTSPLTFLPFFAVLTPFKALRPVALGFTAYGFSYLALNSLLAFHPILLPLWWAQVWLALGSLCMLGLWYASLEVVRLEKK